MYSQKYKYGDTILSYMASNISMTLCVIIRDIGGSITILPPRQ